MSHENGQNFGRESALLMACLRHRLSRPNSQLVRDRIAPNLNWRRVAEMADSHRVRALVYAVLTQFPDVVPQAVLTELRSAYRASALETLFLVSRLVELIHFLESDGIPVIPFKGPILAGEVHGDFAMRAVGDLDLLVSHGDIVRARQLLIDRGFVPIFPARVPRERAYLESLTGRRLEDYVRSHAEHHLASPDGRVAVDLHWGIALKEYALPLDAAELWRHVRQINLAGHNVRTLGAEELLVVLCINGAKDSWSRLDRICDVAALLTRHPQLDWPSVLTISRTAGATRILAVTLALVRDLLDFPLPPAISPLIEKDTAAVRLATQIRPRLFLPARPDCDSLGSFSGINFQLRLRDRLGDRCRFLLAQFNPTVGDWAACPLPENLRLLHYLIRPVRLLVDRAAAP